MAVWGFIYNVNIGSLVDELELSVKGDLRGKVDSDLIYSVYCIQRDRADDPVENRVLGSNDMKDMAEVLRDSMNPEAHGHVLSTAQGITLRYKAPFLGEKEDRDSTRKDYHNGGLKERSARE